MASNRETIENFIEFLFEGHSKGFVYAPFKAGPRAEDFHANFFSLRRKKVLVDYLVENAQNGDVYVAPALFKSNKSPEKRWVLESSILFADFDGNSPQGTLPNNLPEPSWKIQTSLDGHEHWFWKLESPLVGPGSIEQFQHPLVEVLGADNKVKDAGHVLRIPGTHNFKRGGLPVETLSSARTVHGFGSFGKTLINEGARSVDVNQKRTLREALEHVTFTQELSDLFNATFKEGERSEKVHRLAMELFEHGAEVEYVYPILKDAVDRWYKGAKPNSWIKREVAQAYEKYRENQAGLGKKVPVEEPSMFKPVQLDVFLKTKLLEPEWSITRLLAKNSLGVIASDAGIGKTTFMLHLGMSVATGENFLHYEVPEPQRVGFVSFEMGAHELLPAVHQIAPHYSDFSNFDIFPVGEFGGLTDKNLQKEFRESVFDTGTKFLIVDSLQDSVGSDSDTQKEYVNWIKSTFCNNGVTVWLIHHFKKEAYEAIRNGEEIRPGHLYGPQEIGARASAILGLFPHKQEERRGIRIDNPKIRLAPKHDIRYYQFTEDVNYAEITKENLVDEMNSMSKGNGLANQYTTRTQSKSEDQPGGKFT